MKINDIVEAFNYAEYKSKLGYIVGSDAFAFNPARSDEIVPVQVTQMNFMGKDFKVVYPGNPPNSGNGGQWAADTEDLYKTREEAAKAMFKDKLKGKR